MLVNTDWIITLPAAPSKEPEVVKTTKAPIRQRLTPEEWGRVWLKMVAAILVTLFLVGCTLESPSLPGYAAVVMLVGCLAAFGALTYFDDDRALIHRLCRGETPQMQLDRARDELYAIARGSEAPAKETIKVAYGDLLLIALITSAAKEHPDYLTAEEYRVKHEQECISGDCDHYPYSVWDFAPEAIGELLDRNHDIVDDYLQDIGLREYLEIMSRLGGSKDDLKRKSALQAIIDNAAEATWNSIKLDQVAQLETARERADRAIAANELLFLPAA